MPLRRMPASLEASRKEFNEQSISRKAQAEAGIVVADAREQSESQPIIPARRGRPKRTGRTDKSDTRQRRGNGRKGSPSDSRKGRTGLRNKNQGNRGPEGSAQAHGTESARIQSNPARLAQVGPGVLPR